MKPARRAAAWLGLRLGLATLAGCTPGPRGHTLAQRAWWQPLAPRGWRWRPSRESGGGLTGFESQLIPAGATWLIGVQYLLLPPPPAIVDAATGTTPQDVASARGVMRISASAGSMWMMLATVRQVFTTYDGAGNLLDRDSAACPVALVGGPEQTF